VTSRLAIVLVAAQLAAIGAPCPVAPLWQEVEVARAISAPPPCPDHASAEHAREAPRTSMVFRCPCGCSDGLPPASGVHHSRAAVLPAAQELDASPPSLLAYGAPAWLAPQHDPSGIRHVPRAA
jgi:hypothetical protein